MKIIPLEIQDLDKILEIEKEAYQKPWLEKDYLYELKENPFAYYFKVVEKDEIIGYYGFWITFETAQLCKITIKRKFQGLKIAHILMEDLEKRIRLAHCENITLEVRVSNQKAINLYQKHGFIIVSTRKNYYENHEDAYLMIKELNYDENISN